MVKMTRTIYVVNTIDDTVAGAMDLTDIVNQNTEMPFTMFMSTGPCELGEYHRKDLIKIMAPWGPSLSDCMCTGCRKNRSRHVDH